MSEILLEAKNISKSFVGVRALDAVDLTIEKGEIHCLIGENGSGKSTLIKIIGGVYKADDGTVTVGGKKLHKTQSIESIRAGIQIIYQDLSLFPNLTVAENISINQMLESNQRTVSWKSIHESAKKALKEIGEEQIPLNERIENLSMAKKQIVAISRALTQNAKLIIMDEATSAITKEEVDHLFSIILNLKSKGISTLFVSHKLSEVFEISEKITIIRDGKTVGVFSTAELDRDKLIYLMTGRKLEFKPYIYKQNPDEEIPLLKVQSLSKENQFSNINFELKKGEILGITGLIGSGRTEVAQAIFGLNKPDHGEIFIDGIKVSIRNPRDAIKYGMAFLPEDRLGQGLFDVQPIGDNIVITILRDLLGKCRLLDPKKRKESGDYWVEKLEIKTPTATLPVNSLSGGNQQRVVLAKWLATKPKVFILDGPTIGIDIGSKHTIHEIIRHLAEQGMGFIMISDEIQEILDNCNRILLMSNGHIIEKIEDPTKTTADELYEVVTRGINQR
ncbi:MAG: simple sugar transport system ATP-binding protein [Verrucomicrobiota bacterium]|nr:simple sugar transport system ATP-binding protein [Verrucomicrobiota bacterium]